MKGTNWCKRMKSSWTSFGYDPSDGVFCKRYIRIWMVESTAEEDVTC